MRFLKGKADRVIQEYECTIGETTISLPFAEFLVPERPHMLITAGLDGDEYTGIEAAYELISHFKSLPPLFSVTILPLVNIPGFDAAVSYNPLDGLYPKHIFPGKRNGKPTEQLMYHLAERFLSKKMLWIDFHSGSLQESLIPFVWSYQTKKHATIAPSFLSVLSSLYYNRIVYSNYPPERITALSEKGTGYLMLEAGQMGSRRVADIDLLVSSVTSIQTAFFKGAIHDPFSAFSSVTEYRSHHSGLWYPLHSSGDFVTKGEKVGIIFSPTKEPREEVRAKKEGLLLWQKSTLAVLKHDILLGIATDREEFNLTS